MIADDRLQTVLRMDSSTPLGARVQYLQILDILAQHSLLDPRWQAVGLAHMHALREHVSADVRARHLDTLGRRITSPALVRYLSADVPLVTAAVMRAAKLSDQEWLTLLPNLPIRARGFLRNRRDLSPVVTRALSNYGASDWVLPQAESELIAANAGYSAEREATPAIPLPTADEPWVDGGEPDVVDNMAREHDRRKAQANEQEKFVEALIANTPPSETLGNSTNEIRQILQRIEEFRRSRPEYVPEAPLLPLDSFEQQDDQEPVRIDFETNVHGAFTWVKGARGVASPLIGSAPFRPHSVGVGILSDAGVKSAFSRRAIIRSGQVSIASPPLLKGQWRVDAQPFFEPVSGRFLGYRGRLRRPRFEESPRPTAFAENTADSFRQLMHELKTPLNAIAGFSDVIAEQLFGPADAAYREMARNIGKDASQLLRDFEDMDRAIRAREEGGPEDASDEPVCDWVKNLAAKFVPEKVGIHFVGDGIEASRHFIANRIQADRVLSRMFSAVLPELESFPAQCVARLSDGRLDLDIPVPAHWSSLSTKEILSGKEVENDGQTHSGRAFALRLAMSMAEQINGNLLVSGSRLCLTLPCVTTSRNKDASEVQG